MAADDNPRDDIPGTRSRFRFPYSDRGYAFIGPAIVLLLVVLVVLYAVGDWVGDRQATTTGQNAQPPAVTPGPSPQSPSTNK